MTAPQKAELEIEGGATIKCLFNPTEYKISKSNSWNFKEVTGVSSPEPEFTGGQPRELSLTILLDASILDNGQTVRGITDELFKMMQVPDGQPAGGARSDPPFLTFRWGTGVTFRSACMSLSAAYQLFRQDGEPIRAEVSMTLKEVKTGSQQSSPGGVAAAVAAPAGASGSNPTSAGSALAQGVHVVTAGDSLASIAQQRLGDARLWPALADANRIDNPFHLKLGMSVTLPRLEFP